MAHKYETLSDAELLFGYKEIVLYYETVITHDSKGFDVGEKEFQSFIKGHQIVLFFQNNQDEVAVHDSLKDYESNPVAFFSFSPSKGMAQVPSLLSHLRNCFAHGGVTNKEIGKTTYFCFEDYDPITKKYSLKGQIPTTQFKEFINKLKQSKSK